ncbi:MAG: hypothetical protein AAF693_17010 [Bacteroidota bacterium]
MSWKKWSIWVVAGLFLACNDYEGFLESLNEPGEIILDAGPDKHGLIVNDSLKKSRNDKIFMKDVKIFYSDINQNVREVRINSVTNDVFLIQEDTVLIDKELVAISDTDSVTLSILCYEEGFKQLEFTIVDDFDRRSSATLRLLVFDNLLPVVIYEVTVDRENNLVTFDLTKSYDADANFGGQIREYELIFNGETLIKPVPEFTVLTSITQRVYDYALRVTDNNGESSLIITDRLNL